MEKLFFIIGGIMLQAVPVQRGKLCFNLHRFTPILTTLSSSCKPESTAKRLSTVQVRTMRFDDVQLQHTPSGPRRCWRSPRGFDSIIFSPQNSFYIFVQSRNREICVQNLDDRPIWQPDNQNPSPLMNRFLVPYH